ncbi:MAG: trigger factor [Clostridiales bacterium]|jgi:trigger factor|nr:trigger factor [Clostridiales bacterium]
MSDSTKTTSTLEHIEENLVKLTLNIEPAQFEKALNQAYLKNRGQIALPGFRRGRAPRKMIERQFGKEVFYEDALDIIFPDAYEAALEEHNLDVVSAPEVDLQEADGGAIIIAEVHTKPHVEVEDYTGITYTRPDITITDEEIDAEVDRNREANARIHSIEDRPAQNGDIVTIDFEGFVDGVPFPGGAAEDFELVLGSGSFIPGFEDQIVGKDLDDSFDVNVTFPEDYHAEDLAGKDAVFKVTLHDINHKEVPEADDDFAQEVSEYDTLDEFKAEIRSKIEEHKQADADRLIENQLLSGLARRISPNIPKPMLEQENQRLMRDFANRVQGQGMNFGSYMQMMGMDMDGLRNMYTDQARENILIRLALEAIIKKEGIEANDEEYDQELTRLADQHRMERATLEESIGEDEEDAIRQDIKAKKAIGLIKAAATQVEAPQEEGKEDSDNE